MPQQFNTLEEFIKENHYNYLFKRLSKYVYENQKDFDIKGYDTDDYSYVKLDDIHISKVYIDSKDKIIHFTIQVQTDLVVKLKRDRDFEEDNAYKWFTVYATGTLENKFSDFRVTGICEYEKNKFDKKTSLSKDFLPYISNDDLDVYAAKFLKEFYPLALNEPVKLPIDEIITKMGLRYYYSPLKSNTFGQIFFNKSKAKIFDDNNDVIEEMVDEGTILINKNAFFFGNYGNEANTKTHECVHWWLHKQFFDLLKIISPKVSSLSCEVDSEYKNECSKSDALQWMEWQACSIAPKILIPKEMGIRKFKEILKNVKIEEDDCLFDKRLKFEMAVDRFANFFGTTMISAKIRLIELGFTQAIGVCNFIDGKPCDSFYFKEGSLEPGQSFLIDVRNAAIESYLNPTLRKKILNNEVLYINNVFVLNSDKYVGQNSEGKYYLTSYALNHMDECCIIFDYTKEIKKKPSYFNLCFLCRSIDITNSIEAKYSSTNKAEISQEDINRLLKKQKEENAFFKDLPSDGPRTIKAHLKRKGVTQQELAKRSNMSPRTIAYYVSDYDNPNPNIFDIAAICIGLNLSPNYSRDLFTKFGFNIDGKHNDDYNALRFVIENCHHCTIDSCNDILAKLNCSKRIPSGKEPKKD